MSESGQDVYLREIEAVLPRLLALYDRDPTSPTFGLGDRLYWGWKLIDFPNATPQGAVHGLARLLSSGLLPQQFSRRTMLARIDNMITAAGRITAADGSLVEAFPRESSFCVTALVAYDVLCAIDLLQTHIDREMLAKWKKIVGPLVSFLIRNEETHAFISNHLATGSAALMRWDGDDRDAARARGEDLLQRILRHQSPEGWFSEYGSADPGYETLGLTYLADIHARMPQLGLSPALRRSVDFLTYFAHPDRSFGGLYGGRNTRFIVPGGLEMLAREFPSAQSLARFTRRAIADRTIVTLSTLDEGNLAPIFNGYCRAATAKVPARAPAPPTLPFEDARPWRRHFKESGLIVDNGPLHYTVVALNKGGLVQHYKKDGISPAQINAGALARKGALIFSTQAYRSDNRVVLDSGDIVVEAPFIEMISERPTPSKFVLLRLLSLTLFRYRPLLEWVKRRLVERLITKQKSSGVFNRRTIRLGPDLVIEDDMIGEGLRSMVVLEPFNAIHMASAGYWQRQDDAV